MNLLSIILEIRFSKNIPLIEIKDNRQEFIENISNEKIKPPPEINQGLQHKHVKTKTFVTLENNRFAIATEISSINGAEKRIIEILEYIYKYFRYNNLKILRIGMKTLWIEPWNSNFGSLMNLYKDKFYIQNQLIKESIDVAINLTLQDNPYKVNFISGPMKPEQANSFLIFKDRDLPHDFIFIDIDRFDTENNTENNVTSIKQFINLSIKSHTQLKNGTEIGLLKTTR